MSKISAYQIVTNRIIEMLQKGVTPWRKTWKNAQHGIRPQNHKSKHIYKGINYFLLFSCFDNPYYLTFNQVRELGGKVKKGEKASPVFYWNWLYLDANGNKVKEEEKAAKKIPFLKYYNVFNATQIQGIEFKALPKPLELPENKKIESCEKLVKGCKGLRIKHQRNEAFYSPTADFINMPNINFFTKSEAYYSTLFHELAHWTGHASRLNRFKKEAKPASFGSKAYSKEELIAEMTSAFLCFDLKIDLPEIQDNHAAYLKSWINVLKGDERLITSAATAAEKAAKFIKPT